MSQVLLVAWSLCDDAPIVKLEVESDDREWLNDFAFIMQEMSFHSDDLFIYREA